MESSKNQWATYMKWRKYFQIVLIAYVPLVILASILIEDLSVAFFIGFGFVVVLPLGLRHIFFACPSCGQPIHFKTSANFLGRVCSHCGIRIGEHISKK